MTLYKKNEKSIIIPWDMGKCKTSQLVVPFESPNCARQLMHVCAVVSTLVQLSQKKNLHSYSGTAARKSKLVVISLDCIDRGGIFEFRKQSSNKTGLGSRTSCGSFQVRAWRHTRIPVDRAVATVQDDAKSSVFFFFGRVLLQPSANPT